MAIEKIKFSKSERKIFNIFLVIFFGAYILFLLDFIHIISIGLWEKIGAVAIIIIGSLVVFSLRGIPLNLNVQNEMKDIKKAMYPAELEKTEHYDANGKYTGSSIKIKKD